MGFNDSIRLQEKIEAEPLFKEFYRYMMDCAYECTVSRHVAGTTRSLFREFFFDLTTDPRQFVGTPHSGVSRKISRMIAEWQRNFFLHGLPDLMHDPVRRSFQ